MRGQLLESATGRAIAGGEVVLADTAGAVVALTTTDALGRFVLDAPEPGSYLLVASALGYARAVDGILDLGEGGSIELEFFLRPAPIELPELAARAQRARTERYLDNQGFYDRRDMGFGHFIGPEELEARPPADQQDLLRRVPRVRMADHGFAGQTVSCGGLEPIILVDGVRVEFLRGVDLEEVVKMTDLAAVEVFTGPAQIPLQYGGLTGEKCVILLWTKH